MIAQAVDRPQGPAEQIGMINLIYLVVVSISVGWLAYKLAESTGRHSPETEAMIAGVADLFGGPLIYFLFFR